MYIFDSDLNIYTFTQNLSSNWAIFSYLLLVKITKEKLFMLNVMNCILTFMVFLGSTFEKDIHVWLLVIWGSVVIE